MSDHLCHLRSLLVSLLLILPGAARSQADGYHYSVDLTKVIDDRLLVELIPPPLSENNVVFSMPRIIPGAYAICDFGRYISKPEAIDNNGKRLHVEQIGTNQWRISNAARISKLSYWVEDSFDSNSKPEIFWPAGTNIEQNRNFLINTAGFFGYFERLEDIPFHLTIVHPPSLYGATGLQKSHLDEVNKKVVDRGASVDRFSLSNYEELIDSPLMYSEPDTVRMQVANSTVLVASYSPNKLISAKEISASIRDVLEAQQRFLGGTLPVEKYAFLFYFTDSEVMTYGALEHSYSSVYYMPEDSIVNLADELEDFAAHEFLHILTPLTIQSDRVHDFDFDTPRMSQHLWLYEGVTEYFAHLVKVKYGLITHDQYVSVLREKLHTSDQFVQDVAFTDISQEIHDRYHDQFYNVYNKGALIALCLDLKLLKQSHGRYGLRDLMLDLSKKFGKEKPFKDEVLFDEITKLTFPKVGEFFNRYVKGIEMLPLTYFLNAVGINYVEEKRTEDYSLGISREEVGVTKYDGKPKLQISSTQKQNAMGASLGLREGDILIAINDRVLPDLGPELVQALKEIHRSLDGTDTLSYKVMRKNESHEWKETCLAAPVTKVQVVKRHLLEFNPNATKEQIQLRDAWLKP